jgi:hypothetical protein
LTAVDKTNVEEEADREEVVGHGDRQRGTDEPHFEFLE